MAVTEITSRRRNGDGLFFFGAATAAASLLLLAGGILLIVFWAARPALHAFGFAFLPSVIWDPVANIYGAAPVVFGTIITSLLALALAGPLGVGAAVFLSELAPAWLRKPVSFAVELLAAIPSIVYGLWGLFVLAPWLRSGPGLFLESRLGFLPVFRGPSIGVGVLTASLVLTIMILPTITAISREVMRTVPTEQREGMFALGATRWEMITRVVLPNSKVGITGALLLALGRAVGEAMAVTMVIGNANVIPRSLLAPAQTIASLIVNEFPEAFSLHLSSLFLLGLLLLIITLVINAAAVWFVYQTNRWSSGTKPAKPKWLRRISRHGQ